MTNEQNDTKIIDDEWFCDHIYESYCPKCGIDSEEDE